MSRHGNVIDVELPTYDFHIQDKIYKGVTGDNPLTFNDLKKEKEAKRASRILNDTL